MLDKLKPYKKAIVAVVGAVLTWAISNYANDPDVSKWLGLVSAVLTAAGVYQVTNEEV